MPLYVQGIPAQGALYHALQAQVAANHSGIGPNNVGQNPYRGMVGLNFQKPLSGTTPTPPTVPNQLFR